MTTNHTHHFNIEVEVVPGSVLILCICGESIYDRRLYSRSAVDKAA